MMAFAVSILTPVAQDSQLEKGQKSKLYNPTWAQTHKCKIKNHILYQLPQPGAAVYNPFG